MEHRSRSGTALFFEFGVDPLAPTSCYSRRINFAGTAPDGIPALMGQLVGLLAAVADPFFVCSRGACPSGIGRCAEVGERTLQISVTVTSVL